MPLYRPDPLGNWYHTRAVLILICGLLAAAAPASADIALPDLISDHMVLKRSAQTPLWGTADPGEKVSVTLDGQTVSTTADAAGDWQVFLDLLPPRWWAWLGWSSSGYGPYDMVIRGNNEIIVRDVVIGDVWVASGQSNMEWSLDKTEGAKEEIAASANPLVREFLVERNSSLEPAAEAKGRWRVASPETRGKFSAVAYYFAKDVASATARPVGIIASSWGGTNIENWMSREAVDRLPAARAEREKFWQLSEAYPAAKENFTTAMRQWIETHDRGDIASPDPAVFAAPGASTEGWQEVKLPGEVVAPGLPRTGIIWLRKEVEIPPDGGPLRLILPIDGYYSVYFDGKLVNETTFESFPGRGSNLSAELPPGEASDGRHVIAIRIYQPDRPARFTRTLSLRNLAQTVNLDGPWQAKAEHTFPAISPEVLAAAPVPPEQAPPPHKLFCALFNGMIAPLLDYGITGVIWYQGENNAGRSGTPYRESFPALIADWRARWGQGDFPFFFCQLANHKDKTDDPGQESPWAELREAQSSVLSVPATGQAVLIDLGEAGDIHPRNKRDVGQRLARIALARHHGRDLSHSGPVFDAVDFRDGKAVVAFKHADGGLQAAPLPETYPLSLERNAFAPLVRNSPQSQLEGFAIRGEDGPWHWADAVIDGNKVVVSSPQVPRPVAVRYGWADNPTVNLINAAVLPAAPFRAQLSGEKTKAAEE